MKIAISAKGSTLDSLLDERFGRCENFIIYNSESKEFKVLENKGQNSKGGAGISASQQLIDEKVDVIITGHLGPNAYAVISKAGIKPYMCKRMLISSAIEKFENGQLNEITEVGQPHKGI